MKLNFANKAPMGAALAAVLFLAGSVANAAVINFNPGTYYLSATTIDPPVDTLTITLNGGVADFVLTGLDSATFSVLNHSVADGIVSYAGDNPYYDYGLGKITSTSWDASLYPFITFYTITDAGGFSIGSSPGDAGSNNLIDLYSSSQLFSVSSVPLPATLPLMLSGVGMLGFAMRRKRGAGQSRTCQ